MTTDTALITVAAIAAVSNIVSSFINRKKIDNLREQINGGSVKQIEAAFTRGVTIGIAQERQRRREGNDSKS
jgi:hypothetical protein